MSAPLSPSSDSLPSPETQSAPLPPHELRSIPSVDPRAHHIDEFGAVDRIVHLPTHKGLDHEHDPFHPTASTAHRHAPPPSHKWSKLRSRLLMKRHLMQYFYDDILYRTRGIRKVTTEELFLDLIIVAVVAALGHELRESAISWEALEKFMLLFSAVYISWRGIVILWNLWGVQIDFAGKIGVYLTVLSLTGIAIGAHNAFDDVARTYVGVSAFLATAVPQISGIFWSLNERLLKNPANRVNQLVLMNSVTLLCVVPYLVAAFMKTERATRSLYWVAFGLQSLLLFAPYKIYSYLHRNVEGYTRLAVNIELFVEKYEVLTMIVMGETLIGLLFEAGSAITFEGVRVGHMYLSAMLGTATLYSIQTLYVQIDSPIPKGGRHAIRHNVLAGYMWSFIHMPYHFFLIMFATGLAISLRDVALPPDGIVTKIVRAEGGLSAATGTAQFTTNARWLYAVGWAGSLIWSGLMSGLHEGGARAVTKGWRVVLRGMTAVGIMVGLPFSGLRAEWFQMVIAGVSVGVSSLEFLVVQMERVGFFRREDGQGGSGNDGAGASDEADKDSDEDSDTDSDPYQEEGGEGSGTRDLERGGPGLSEDVMELENRLQRKDKSRLVQISTARDGGRNLSVGFG
eukprot:GFKZ01002762.1.p1 GENE.GFKZ01002762.1~~GFKZ01002762.1.p1  ORF type:complete len:626 (-),score=72.62 GFKZ01002762.1:40-1917(-)